jgi:hypothetical protein
MNLLEIRTDSRRLLAEKNILLSYYDDPDMNKFINAGVKHMCIEAGVYEKTISVSVSHNVSDYFLPLDFLAMKVVMNHKGTQLDPLAPQQVGGVYMIAGLPLNYYMLQKPATFGVWVTGTFYSVFPNSCLITLTYIRPSTANGYVYECLVSGQSHAVTEPTWGIIVGSRQADNTVTWACRELFSTLNTLNLHSMPTNEGGGVGLYKVTYSALDEGLYVDTDCPNFPAGKHHYLVMYACAMAALKAKNIELATTFLADYSAGLGLKMGTSGGESAKG